MKDYDINKELSHIKYWYVNDFYRCATSQNIPANDFKWFEHIPELDESSIKSSNEESDERYFQEVDIQYLKKYITLTIACYFQQKERKLKESKSS